MATLNISSTTAGSAGLVVEIWERGSGTQADTHVETRLLGSGNETTRIAVGSKRYLVVRDAGDSDSDAKTIDNWSQAPAPPGDA